MGRLLEMHANEQIDIDDIHTGDIVAAIGMKNTRTGDTLSAVDHPIQLESMTFPAPVISVAIEPKTKVDSESLGEGLQRLAEEDPTFLVRTDEETGQTIIAGMGELHLDVIVDRLLREFRVEANVGRPQVAYRETIKKPVEKVRYTHTKQTGGKGQFADVIISLEATGPGGGYEFVDMIKGGNIPREYISSVDAGIEGALEQGVLAGYPLVDVRALLTDGSYHDVDSSEMAFRVAGSMALQRGRPIGRRQAPRADHGGRGGHARGLHGRCHRRPLFATWQGRRDGFPRKRQGRHGRGTVGRDVRICNGPAVEDPGTSDVHHAISFVPGRAGVDLTGDRRQGTRRAVGGNHHGQGKV